MLTAMGRRGEVGANREEKEGEGKEGEGRKGEMTKGEYIYILSSHFHSKYPLGGIFHDQVRMKTATGYKTTYVYLSLTPSNAPYWMKVNNTMYCTNVYNYINLLQLHLSMHMIFSQWRLSV